MVKNIVFEFFAERDDELMERTLDICKYFVGPLFIFNILFNSWLKTHRIQINMKRKCDYVVVAEKIAQKGRRMAEEEEKERSKKACSIL